MCLDTYEFVLDQEFTEVFLNQVRLSGDPFRYSSEDDDAYVVERPASLRFAKGDEVIFNSQRIGMAKGHVPRQPWITGTIMGKHYFGPH